jgi:hypothetical protein
VLVYAASTRENEEAANGRLLDVQGEPHEPPSRLLRTHPVAKNFVDQDALVGSLGTWQHAGLHALVTQPFMHGCLHTHA